MELLVIDEVSMLRADLLDAMDYMMQTVRKNTNLLVEYRCCFGDLLQLPPVIRDEEWRTAQLQRKVFFSFACRTKSAIIHELSTIYRQTDTEFISVLNNLRNKLPQPMFKR
jgi:hypothetical protein